MRILWSSNSPWTRTGYGVQSRLCIDELAEKHDVAAVAWYGLEGGILNYTTKHGRGIPLYPKGAHPYGADVLGAHAQHYRADIVITLIDAFAQEPAQMQGARWCPWFPIDSEPVSPRIVEKVKEAYQPIVFSQFAVRECERAGLPAMYVPHLVDTEAYQPMDAAGRAEARRRLQLPPEAFVVLMVAANKDFPSRKSWPQCLEAFARFRQSHPDAFLYAHTMPMGGVNLPQLCISLGIPPESVRFTDPYMQLLGLGEDWMRNLYCASDVLLNPAMGEGFGVPILEAQACGVPVVVGGWTAMEELCWGGWAIPREEADRHWMPVYDTWMWRPRTDAILRRLETAHAVIPERRQELADKARAGAMPYDAATVVRDYWLPALDKIAERIGVGAGEVQFVKF